ncbi:MAG: hypothetical protein Q8M06_09270 [Methanobacteriaceae archaeon]|nr:hypothetical protein [Methanobacteriaceae archaeon]MDZ4172446.1 hypothetical protein [Methanobacteriaceae archaeon]
MPDLGPMGRGGARRRTRRRMVALGAISKKGDDAKGNQEFDGPVSTNDYNDKLQKLSKLLKNKGVITESEYDLLFG